MLKERPLLELGFVEGSVVHLKQSITSIYCCPTTLDDLNLTRSRTAVVIGKPAATNGLKGGSRKREAGLQTKMPSKSQPVVIPN